MMSHLVTLFVLRKCFQRLAICIHVHKGIRVH